MVRSIFSVWIEASFVRSSVRTSFSQVMKRRFLSCEQVVETSDLAKGGSFHTLKIHRGLVDGVLETPNGAHFTECPPDYGRDEAFQREYAATAQDPDAWQRFVETYLSLESEDAYQAAVRAR